MSVEAATEESELEPAARGSIVVGHDGSDCANHALSSALVLADKLLVPVVVVRAWSLATAPNPPDWAFGYVSSTAEYSAAVYEELVRDARETVEKYPGVSISYRSVHADPAKSLIDVARNARMLVVGSRGLGGLAGMLVGSVSDQCVRHATCPVLVARPSS